jgi:hypothetical protein
MLVFRIVCLGIGALGIGSSLEVIPLGSDASFGQDDRFLVVAPCRPDASSRLHQRSASWQFPLFIHPWSRSPPSCPRWTWKKTRTAIL